MRAFRERAEQPISLTWQHQCFCGSIEARLYRKAYWCARCGSEKRPTSFGCGNPQCPICSLPGQASSEGVEVAYPRPNDGQDD